MNFDKNFHIYDKHATVQKIVASNLVSFINKSSNNINFNSIFEIGCGTGIFTRAFLNYYNPNKILLNDYFNTESYLKGINYFKFYEGNIENISIPKVDAVISSSALQWVKNFEDLIVKIANSTDKFYFSIYLKDNLIEINKHFNISLDYFTLDEIKITLEKYFSKVISFEETHTIEFSSPLETLRHLKNTGVTGFKKSSIKEIRSFSSSSLTYQVGYFYCEK